MSNSPNKQAPEVVDHQIEKLTKENEQLKVQIRNRFSYQTHHHVQEIPHLVDDWKEQAKNKWFENREKKGKDRYCPLTEEESEELADAMIQNRETIISNLKVGNEGFEKQVEGLKQNSVGHLTDLIIKRFEAFVVAREKMIVAVEKEKEGLMEAKIQREQSEYSDHWIFKM
ncbi:uncharacterized protein B0J16DRAFT_383461 [Fusarium flagelliforme]|uniref:uncharacterized protein n=1 Tax=Fusarium flagelliforme TaxID=2675880 RepID=UPI001E8E0F39|nr:uncharacterized protein B0J16DRAFT_383461 [Fusarium flagelliforme]KAH7189593.1 hypothetical protein B0J16DRAFT_383461 [Fusarium flagelliforme]